MLVNAPLRLDAWPPDAGCQFSRYLGDYFRAAAEQVRERDVDRRYRELLWAVPLWNKLKWVPDPSDPLAEYVTRLHDENHTDDCSCASKLVAASQAQTAEQVTRCIDKIEPCLSGDERLKRAWKEFVSFALDNDPVTEFPQMLRAYQTVSALQPQGLKGAQELRELLANVLRKWAAHQAHPKWRNLFETFSTDLHSQPSLARLVRLSDDEVKHWGVASEFAIFGVRHANGALEWKAVLATSLDYPFDVARITVLNESQLGEYKRVITNLLASPQVTEPLPI
jgi:hypothetical protein